MFENLKKRVMEDSAMRIKENNFFIENGYLPTWSEKERTFSDRGLQQYSTETRWSQYQAGEITREKAVAFAIARDNKKLAKDLEKKLAHLETVSAATDLDFASIEVNWNRSRAWGYNPSVVCYSNAGKTTGHASGCGYDKESAAIAEAFNANNSILKALYSIKENALSAGVSDYSKNACTKVNNTACCGYGAGHTALPYFEGGVGSNCFWEILKKAGYTVSENHGKYTDFYSIEKGEKDHA